MNGDFAAGATGWTSTAPSDSTLVYTGGQLTATSDDNGGGPTSTLATQTFTAGDPGFFSYTLVSYTSTDVADWDWPIVIINGVTSRISTTGTLLANVQNTPGAVTNATGATNLSGVTTLAAGSNTIGAGSYAQDSQLGPRNCNLGQSRFSGNYPVTCCTNSSRKQSAHTLGCKCTCYRNQPIG